MNLKKTFIVLISLFCLFSLYSSDKEIDELFRELKMARIEPVPMMDFKFKDMNGNDLSLSSLKGKMIFFNFWATWCPPCRKEMPSMQKLYNKFKDKNFVMIAVTSEDSATVKQFLSKNKYTFPIVAGEEDIFINYNIASIPTTFIIDGDGYIIGGTAGSSDWARKESINFFEKMIPKK